MGLILTAVFLQLKNTQSNTLPSIYEVLKY